MSCLNKKAMRIVQSLLNSVAMSLGDSTDDTSNWKSPNKTLEREKMSSYHFFMVTLGYRLVLYRGISGMEKVVEAVIPT